MQSADLNLTATVTGHQRFLFIKLPAGDADAGLAEAIGRLGDDMENMHHKTGHLRRRRSGEGGSRF